MYRYALVDKDSSRIQVMQSVDKIIEVDQCFVPNDPHISKEEFFKLAEEKILEKIRQMDELDASLESVEDNTEVETKVINLKDEGRKSSSSIIGWGTFYNDQGKTEKREFLH